VRSAGFSGAGQDLSPSPEQYDMNCAPVSATAQTTGGTDPSVGVVIYSLAIA
jgi:hypothetical protein